MKRIFDHSKANPVFYYLGLFIFTAGLPLIALTQDTKLQYHKLKFYLHPDLAAGLTLEEVKNRISKYAEDLNIIFSKQTVRRFVFDPDEDIVLTKEKPHSEHVFGAGMSEYYNLATTDDSTGIAPVQHIDLFEYPNDPYWAQHKDYLADPLLGNIWDRDFLGNPKTYSDLIKTVRFANVTVAVLNDSLRDCLAGYLPDLSKTRIHVFDESTGKAIPNTNIKVWKVRSFPPYFNQLLIDGKTDSSGVLQFSWDGGFNNYDHLMLIKAYPQGYKPGVRWFSIFDAQAEKMLNGKQKLDIFIPTNMQLPTSANATERISTEFSLSQNYPNPFNPSTTIEYALPQPSHVVLKVYDVLGTEVRTLVNGKQPAGRHRVQLDAKGLPGGVYFYRIEVAEQFVQIKKLMLLK